MIRNGIKTTDVIHNVHSFSYHPTLKVISRIIVSVVRKSLCISPFGKHITNVFCGLCHFIFFILLGFTDYCRFLYKQNLTDIASLTPPRTGKFFCQVSIAQFYLTAPSPQLSRMLILWSLKNVALHFHLYLCVWKFLKTGPNPGNVDIYFSFRSFKHLKRLTLLSVVQNVVSFGLNFQSQATPAFSLNPSNLSVQTFESVGLLTAVQQQQNFKTTLSFQHFNCFTLQHVTNL